MAQDYERDAKRAPSASSTSSDAAAPQEIVASPATFSAAGPIPPVASGGQATAPTASQRAYGAGMQALEALLASGRPEPAKVVELLDAHRDEHDALISLLESKLGAGYVAEVRGAMGLRASVARREVVAGDPADPNAGYFVASQAEQGAKWRTDGGGFTGTVNKNGLDTSVAVDPHDTLHADVKPDKSGTLDWNRDGKAEAELYGSYKDGKDYDAGARRAWGAGGGQLTTSIDHQVANGTATDAAIGSYKSADGKTTAKGEVGLEGGKPMESAQVSAAPTKDSTVSASVGHDAKATTGALGGTYQLGTTKLDGNVTRAADKTTAELGGTEQLSSAWSLNQKLDETVPDQGKPETTGSLGATYKQGKTDLEGNIARDVGKTSLNLGGTEQPSSAWKLTEKLDETVPDQGKPQTVIGAGETYTSGNLVEQANVEGGVGANEYLKATGSLDAGLGNGLYAGGWGSYSVQDGKQDTAQLGASLTFTPDEKQALTLAGVIDQNGAVEARLQYDVFKSKVESVSDLASHKKDALVSLFLSYRADSGHRTLDDRFGAPQLDTGPSQQVTAGIRIKF